MAFAATRQVNTPTRRGLLSEGYDFGFGNIVNDLFGGLPSQAAILVESIWGSMGRYSVISEEPQTWEELEVLIPEVFEPILETRPGRTPDPYPQDVSDDVAPEDDDEVAHTWGHLGREFLGEMLGVSDPAAAIYSPAYTQNFPGGTAAPPAAVAAAMNGCDTLPWSGGTPPKGYKVVNHCGVGVLRKIRRRRRRRMLTASDASDLATIVGIVGKGQMASSMINRTRS